MSRDAAPPPDPAGATTLDELAGLLRELRAAAGSPSYSDIVRRLPAGRAGRNTVHGYFQKGRVRFSEDVLADIVAALRPEDAYVYRWRQALRMVQGGVAAAGFVPTLRGLPPATGPAFVGPGLSVAPGEVVAIHGPSGVGKTRLALEAARGVACEIRLHADLRGYDPVAPQAHPSAVLADFLKHLGMAPTRIPATLEERASAYRRLLHGREAVVVLDNVASPAALEPLVPGGPRCITLITSRDPLPGARSVALGGLAPADALELFRRVAGGGGFAGGALPLEIIIAAAHRRDHPGCTSPLPDDCLSETSRTLLRLMAVQPCADITAEAAAALSGHAVDEVLRQLVTAHLIEMPTPGRYRLHDFVAHRFFGDAQRDALRRMYDHYRATAAHATEMLDSGGEQARAWLDEERVNLLAVATGAGAAGWHGYATDLARLLHRYFDASGHYATAVALYEQVLAWSHEAGGGADPFVRNQLAWMYWRQGRISMAGQQLSRAFADARRTGDRAEIARSLAVAGNVACAGGDFGKAIRSHRASLALYRQLGFRPEEANGLNNLGVAYRSAGRFGDALAAHKRALALSRAAILQRTEALSLLNMGLVLIAQCHPERALEPLAAALYIRDRVGDRSAGAATLNAMGHALRALGRYPEALQHLRRSLVLAQSIGDLQGEAGTLNGLGELLRHQGHAADSAAAHRAALAVATTADIPSEKASAHLGLANALHDAGDTEDARRHWTEALRLHADPSGPQATEIRAHLTHAHPPAKAAPHPIAATAPTPHPAATTAPTPHPVAAAALTPHPAGAAALTPHPAGAAALTPNPVAATAPATNPAAAAASAPHPVAAAAPAPNAVAATAPPVTVPKGRPPAAPPARTAPSATAARSSKP